MGGWGNGDKEEDLCEKWMKLGRRIGRKWGWE